MKPKKKKEVMGVVSFRASLAQQYALRKLGGGRWIREQIDRERMKK